MKKLFKSISLISFSLISFAVMAAGTPRAVVTELRGNVFVTSNGNTKKVNLGDYLYDFDEVITEVGAQVSFNDYYDHTFHLAGAGHLSVLNKLIELRGGYLWVQSASVSDQPFHIQTVNATTSYTEGEFVFSFDSESGKSQLLSVNGTHVLKNNIHDFLKEEVSKGKFSFVSEKYENGAPRVPTPIGVTAYSSVLSLYDGVKPMSASERKMGKIADLDRVETVKVSSGRKIASIASEDQNSGGKIIVIKKEEPRETNRDEMLQKMYHHKVKALAKKWKPKPKKFKPSYDKKSGVALKVYGQKQRMPASVKPKKTSVKPAVEVKVQRPIRKPASMVDLNPQVTVKKDAFENSLIREYKKQLRHSKEMNSLINELKNFDQDYNTAY